MTVCLSHSCYCTNGGLYYDIIYVEKIQTDGLFARCTHKKQTFFKYAFRAVGSRGTWTFPKGNVSLTSFPLAVLKLREDTAAVLVTWLAFVSDYTVNPPPVLNLLTPASDVCASTTPISRWRVWGGPGGRHRKQEAGREGRTDGGREAALGNSGKLAS